MELFWEYVRAFLCGGLANRGRGERAGHYRCAEAGRRRQGGNLYAGQGTGRPGLCEPCRRIIRLIASGMRICRPADGRHIFLRGRFGCVFIRKVNALGGRFLLASFHFLPKRIERQIYVEIEFVSRNVAVFHFDLVVASFVPEPACAWYPAANSLAKRQIGSFFITGVLAGRVYKIK